MIPIPPHQYLVLFDGLCNLCNSSVQFIIKHDTKNHFVFATLQGKTGQQLIKQLNLDTKNVDSILLYSNTGKVYIKSTAALKIAQHLQFPINLWTLCFLVPTVIRHWVYDVVARNRYKWFGKRDACMISTPERQAKFME